MHPRRRRFTVCVLAVLATAGSASAQVCVDCHRNVTPAIVSDWEISKHSANNVDCSEYHGDRHTSAQDVAKALIPTPET